jgi:membrane protease subunit HflC
MQAYETGLRANDTRLVLRPDSNFFKYFGDPTGKEMPKDASPPAAPPSAASGGG